MPASNDTNATLAAVIVPVFNRLELLRETVSSLKAQTLKDAEFLLVDDRSDPQVLDYLRALPTEDPRFKVISKPDAIPRGCQHSRNIGLESTGAETVMFLDSDDLISPTCLEDRYAELARYPEADFVIGRQAIFSGPGQPMHWVNVPDESKSDLDRFLHLTHPLDVPWVNGAALFRKASLDDAKIRYRPEFDWEDVAFHFECIVSGLQPRRMLSAGGADSFYRVTSNPSMGHWLFTVDGMRKSTSMFLWICERLRVANEWNDIRRRTIAASLFQTCILRAIDAGEYALAQEIIDKTANINPYKHSETVRLTAYRTGRQLLSRFPRLRYYWDRAARRFAIPHFFPSGPSTFGTVSVTTAIREN